MIYLLSVLLLFNTLGFALPEEESMLFSKLDEKYLEDKDPDEWVLFAKQIGNFQYTISFPKQPETILDEKNGKISYKTIHNDGLYQLRIEKAPKKLTSDDFAKYVIENLDHPFSSFREMHGKYGPMLEISYHSRSDSFQKRVIFFEEKQLLLTFFVKGEGDFSNFFNSFEIVRPLGE